MVYLSESKLIIITSNNYFSNNYETKNMNQANVAGSESKQAGISTMFQHENKH